MLAAYPGWLVIHRSENRLTAVLDYGGNPRLLASYVHAHLGSRPDGAPHHGYNIRRQTLDPILRNLALGTPGAS